MDKKNAEALQEAAARESKLGKDVQEANAKAAAARLLHAQETARVSNRRTQLQEKEAKAATASAKLLQEGTAARESSKLSKDVQEAADREAELEKQMGVLTASLEDLKMQYDVQVKETSGRRVLQVQHNSEALRTELTKAEGAQVFAH